MCVKLIQMNKSEDVGAIDRVLCILKVSKIVVKNNFSSLYLLL